MSEVVSRRVLVLSVPDALDAALVLWVGQPRTQVRFMCRTGRVDGPEAHCIDYERGELSTVVPEVMEQYQPSHLIVRDGTGTDEDLQMCREFLTSALGGSMPTVRSVIQTHVLPKSSTTDTYGAWLKANESVRADRSLSIVWHDPLTTTYLDCRDRIQHTDRQLASHHAVSPAQFVARQILHNQARNLEYLIGPNLAERCG